MSAVDLSSLTFVQGDAKAYVPGSSVLVLEMWATWCPPCRQTIPHLSELQTKFKSQNVVFVGVTNEDNVSQIKSFVTKMGSTMNYVVAIDSEGTLTSSFMGRYGISGIPHAFVIAKDGKVAWHGHPADPAMEREITKATASPSAPNAASTGPEPSKTYSREELSAMSVRDLKSLLSARHVDASDCIEKGDLIARALKH